MTAVDPTIQPDDVERRLRAWMANQRPDADLTATYTRIVSATASRPQPRFRTRRGAATTRPPSWWAYRSSRLATVVIVALILVLVIGGGIYVGDRLSRDEASPRPAVSLTTTVNSGEIGLEDDDAVPGRDDTRYTSRRFEPRVTFLLHPPLSQTLAKSIGGEICPSIVTSARTIVLPHLMGCVEDVRFVRPWAVACGAAGDHPDADALARAILTIPGATTSGDPRDVQTAALLPAGTFHEPYSGWVIRMSGAGPGVRSTEADPDRCSLLPEPGTTDPIIEMRRDIAALFVLLDIDGRLVVIRWSSSGHDGPSHDEAVARGYASMDQDRSTHLLGVVHDIRFGP